ncbi:MAG TPA: 6-bladed beta-propeller [Gracilimonas sp.]|uniref:6-bladed beta-propeller n=1 Tax=Gracilimonas sp. TaxID=1974203 RepID=UPI002D9AED1F|nr:6-bladed beta-propeller [Gracilimonas sp.]
MKRSLDSLMTPFMNSSKRLLLSIFLCFFLIQCSDNSKPENAVPTELAEQAEKIEPNRVLDEIPQHIQEVENLAIFPGDSEPLYSIDLIQEQTYGETGEPYLVKIYGSVVDDQGRVIVRSANSNYEQQLFIFDSDGTFRSKLGRQGKGPGEYGIILGIYSKNNIIFVLDYTSQRLNEYSSLDYKITRSILFEEWKAPENFKFSSVEPRYDDNYHVTFSNHRSKFGTQEIIQMAKDNEGKEVNFEPLRFPVGYKITTGKSKLPTPTMPLTFLGTTRTELSQRDELFTNWSREFLIKKYDSNGKYQSAIYYPILGVPFILEDYTKSAVFSPNVREIEKALSADGIDIPDRLPVIDRLIIDDENRIWVALPTSSSRETYEWWILEENGELLAKVLLPRDQAIYDIKNGHLYSKETDEESGDEFVAKYRIELTEK